jgi:hypothetical protein
VGSQRAAKAKLCRMARVPAALERIERLVALAEGSETCSRLDDGTRERAFTWWLAACGHRPGPGDRRPEIIGLGRQLRLQASQHDRAVRRLGPRPPEPLAGVRREAGIPLLDRSTRCRIHCRQDSREREQPFRRIPPRGVKTIRTGNDRSSLTPPEPPPRSARRRLHAALPRWPASPGAAPRSPSSLRESARRPPPR